MRLSFTKRLGKNDTLLFVRGDGTQEMVNCPKQRGLPHDMIHYVVESIVGQRGFLSKLASGEQVGYRMGIEPEAEAIERLVETVQAELWSDRLPNADFIAIYQDSCAARGHEAIALTNETLERIRAETNELASRWDVLDLDDSLIFVFEPVV